ncbi:unnamed protein product, partial [Mesorhabditis belari]|uniref:Uncharacterized protein n=1 Tax=Mesorhabditis belari TaxID=2138241 RepID=A0AAF3EDX7_9BILA
MRDWAKPFGEKIQTALDDYLKAVEEKILEKFDGQENIVEKAHEALLLIQKAESDPDQTSTQKHKTIDYILFSQTIPVRTIVSVARNNAVCVPRTTTTSAPTTTTTTMNPLPNTSRLHSQQNGDKTLRPSRRRSLEEMG